MTRIAMKNSTRRVLDLLRGRPMTTHDFLQEGAGNRFGARIAELRELGFRISTEKLKSGAVYRLEHDVERAATAAEQARDRSQSATMLQRQAGQPGSPTTSGDRLDVPLFDAPGQRLAFMDYDEENEAA